MKQPSGAASATVQSGDAKETNSITLQKHATSLERLKPPEKAPTDSVMEMKQLNDASSNTIKSKEAGETNAMTEEKHVTSMIFSKPADKTLKYLQTNEVYCFHALVASSMTK